jgi:iron complex outermembrane receptor protein
MMAIARAAPGQSVDERTTLKVNVTGSNIPRADPEASLPVQIFTRAELQASGAGTVADFLARVPANVLGANDQLAIGDVVHPGLASANLRGFGAGSTLVLVNGRRVANYAYDGSAVDLNAIPLAAVARIEVLKDGASAVYGTDAIAGVVNVILRKNFAGIEAALEGDFTQHGGGDSGQAVVTAGTGTLDADRFNAFAMLSWRKDDALRASQRPFSSTGYRPDAGVNLLSGVSFPANVDVRPGLIASPAHDTGCMPPASIPVDDLLGVRVPICGYDFASTVDLKPQVERTAFFARAAYAFDAQTEFFAEALYATNRFVLHNSPTSVFQSALSSTAPVLYPASGPYYPTAFAAAYGISGDLHLRFRTEALGPQTDDVDTQALRVVVGAQSTFAGWKTDAALVYSDNRQSDSFASGYVSQRLLLPALATGLINPFGPSTPQGDALLASTQITGDTHDAKARTLGADVRASTELGALPGGPAAVAIGAELRRERLDNVYGSVWTSNDVIGVGGDQQSASGQRDVGAAFVETRLPLFERFDVTLAARYDHYSDFGGTFNPRVALGWQPTTMVLLRGSWATGFRAPALYDLHAPVTRQGIVGANLADPLRCPVTDLPEDCPGSFLSSFTALAGGNPDLAPEHSEQANAGVVIGGRSGPALTLDYWNIHKSNVITTLDPGVLFANFSRFASTNIVRGPVEPAFPNLPGPIQYVVLRKQNLGDLRASGVDVDARWPLATSTLGHFTFELSGTYAIDWSEQLDGVHYTSLVARKSSAIAPIPRWKHYATLDWQRGPWGATLAERFQSGYLDANVDRAGDPLPVAPRSASSYELWDLQTRYAGIPNTTVTLGVLNLADRAPPFTNQPYTRQFGYDPVYADPLGRTFYARVVVAFH